MNCKNCMDLTCGSQGNDRENKYCKGMTMHTITFKIGEKVNHPAHYGGDTTYEAIKVIEAWGLGFSLGNTVKYISRAGKKTDNALEDLRKAKFYLDREINILERKAK